MLIAKSLKVNKLVKYAQKRMTRRVNQNNKGNLLSLGLQSFIHDSCKSMLKKYIYFTTCLQICNPVK